MIKLDREQMMAIAALFVVLIGSVTAPVLSFKARSDALQALTDERDMLRRFQLAHRHAGGKADARERIHPAPAKAFLTAQTSGLASAQLEAYLSQVALARQANVLSSSVQQAHTSDARDMVRIQATLNMNYVALQGLLFKLETGTPYVFVDSMTLQTAEATPQYMSMIMVKLDLHAIWRKAPM